MQVKSQQAPTVLLSVVVFLSSVSNQFVWSERNPCEITIVIIVLCFGNHLLKCIFKILENSLNDSKLDKQNSKWEPQEADSQKLWRSMIYIWVRTVYLNLTITKWVIAYFYFLLYSPSINKLPSLASIKKRIIILSWNLCSFVTF